MKRFSPLLSLALALSLLTGCSAIDEKQRSSIFEPDNRNWPVSAELAPLLKEVWINFDSAVTGQPVRLHGLWLPADVSQPGWSGAAQAPLLLFLHGAHWNVTASAPRMQHMQKLGFSVLAIDYRGFGKSTPGLPSEAMAYRGHAGRLELAGRPASGPAALHLRPFAGRGHGHRAGRQSE